MNVAAENPAAGKELRAAFSENRIREVIKSKPHMTDGIECKFGADVVSDSLQTSIVFQTRNFYSVKKVGNILQPHRSFNLKNYGAILGVVFVA